MSQTLIPPLQSLVTSLALRIADVASLRKINIIFVDKSPLNFNKIIACHIIELLSRTYKTVYLISLLIYLFVDLLRWRSSARNCRGNWMTSMIVWKKPEATYRLRCDRPRDDMK